MSKIISEETGKTNLNYLDIVQACFQAVRKGTLIRRESTKDKEFHFQNWFQDRLKDLNVIFDLGGRNLYPDFKLVHELVGFEIKGLAYPGRETTYDSNSQVPSGRYNDRDIYYVFGRYPKDAEIEYPVIDLIICHGDFLNAEHDYVHKNKSIKGFGTYGDILIRDRKMYVAPSPFGLTLGTTSQRTLILPSNMLVDDRFVCIGDLTRVEADKVVVGYEFDLTTNTLTPKLVDNPTARKEHYFKAYRLRDDTITEVKLKSKIEIDDIESDDNQ